MLRRKRIVKRQILPDPKYHDVLVTRFINNLMQGGKRGVAERIFYGALDIIEKRTDMNGVEVFHKAVENTKPILEVRSRRIGGTTYQVPVEVRTDRRTALAIRWLILYAKKHPEHTMMERLAGEFLAAYRKEGAAIKKREDTHKMAEANKAFAHFRW